MVKAGPLLLLAVKEICSYILLSPTVAEQSLMLNGKTLFHNSRVFIISTITSYNTVFSDTNQDHRGACAHSV